MELDIALYNLSSGGGVITSHQLSLQPGTANRKVSNVAAGEKIREENPDNSNAESENKKTDISVKSYFVFVFWQYQLIWVQLHVMQKHQF